MKNYLVGLMLAVTAMTMVSDVVARPLGGGRSIGRQSPTVARQAPAPAPAPTATRPATPAAPAAAPTAPIPPKPGIPWKGILGGALLGAGVAALFSSMGMGGMAGLGAILGPILMIALLGGAVFFIVSMFRRKQQPAQPQFAGFGGQQGGTPEIGSRIEPAAFQPVQAAPAPAAAPAAPWGVPADFDTNAFLRHAKSSFIRMQAAWDKADVNDLREFTTPEVYAELKMQIQERGATADFTDVVSIDAVLLGIETIGHEYLASVKFDGMIKSAPNAAAEPFAEVWNMSKPVSGSSGWVLAGIQQLS